MLTFLLGWAALTVPGYQALVQDLVPRSQLRSAAALNGVAMNLARAVGPAVAGLLVAQVGVAAVFALDRCGLAAFVPLCWPPCHAAPAPRRCCPSVSWVR